METIIKNYLQALEDADLGAMLMLFSPNALIYSPLYGPQKPRKFYQDLFRDTQQSKIQLLDIYTNLEKHTASVNFIYEWTMANESQTTFDCVDIFHFDGENKITQLKIIYDTQQARPLFNEL